MPQSEGPGTRGSWLQAWRRGREGGGEKGPLRARIMKNRTVAIGKTIKADSFAPILIPRMSTKPSHTLQLETYNGSGIRL
jgi:hypothetical protein